MKVKNFAKKLVGEYDIDIIFDSNPEEDTISGEKCYNYCVADKYGDEKISQILIDKEGGIILVLKKAKVYIREIDPDDDWDFDEDFYKDKDR